MKNRHVSLLEERALHPPSPFLQKNGRFLRIIGPAEDEMVFDRDLKSHFVTRWDQYAVRIDIFSLKNGRKGGWLHGLRIGRRSGSPILHGLKPSLTVSELNFIKLKFTLKFMSLAVSVLFNLVSRLLTFAYFFFFFWAKSECR